MKDDRWTEMDELMLRRTTTGLSEDELERLNELLADAPEEDREWIDRLIGELDAELIDRDAELPAALRASLEAQAEAVRMAVRPIGERTVSSASRGSTRSSASPTASASGPDAGVGAGSSGPSVVGRAPSRGFAWLGWAAAAVLTGFLLLPAGDDASTGPGIGPGPEIAAGPPSPEEAFQSLAARSDAVRLSWTTTEDPTATGASGEVVWSDEAQTGFMRFAGLQANDPEEFQYQLWVFDAERDERFPVDGGVFDIPAGADEVIVPIEARLPVGSATLFAVTVERPGGVVVSDRSRIAVLAQAE